jgi:nicotinamidase-related amidase
MSTFVGRPNTALIVIDVQTRVFAAAHDRRAVVANIAAIVDKARAEGVPVIWVQHGSDELPKGSDAWRIVPELSPADGEPRIEKAYGDSFEATDLEAHLARLKVGRLVIVGGQTDGCIRATLHGAFTRGYDVTLVTDAHSTEDLSQYGAPSPDKVIAHTNLYWRFQTGPGRTAATVEAKDLDFAAAA